MDENLEKFAEACRQRLRDFEATTVKCGLVGRAGSGKSSLINAILGQKVAPVGVVETTQEASEHEFSLAGRGLILVDLPGIGTKSWPRETYVERLKLLAYDCFLLITADRFTEDDLFLFQELTSRGKPCFVVRSKFDRAVEEGALDNGLSEAEVRQQIVGNTRENLQPAAPERIYLTSARYPARYDLSTLLNDVSEALTGLKRSRFVADMAAWSEGSLRKKRELALQLMPVYAGLSAANGLNPLPGLDIAADLGLLLKLGHAVAEIYGLTNKQMEYAQRLLRPEAFPALLTRLGQFAAKYLAREGLILLLRQLTGMGAKEVSKWIPFVGPLIAAGIGWKSTFMFGEQMVNEAEALAHEILRAVIQQTEEQGPEIG